MAMSMAMRVRMTMRRAVAVVVARMIAVCACSMTMFRMVAMLVRVWRGNCSTDRKLAVSVGMWMGMRHGISLKVKRALTAVRHCSITHCKRELLPDPLPGRSQAGLAGRANACRSCRMRADRQRS